MKCEICGRKTDITLCRLHEEAYKNLLKAYEKWKESTGISWPEYLRAIQTNPYAGVWAKEVAQRILTSSSPEAPEGLGK